MKRILTTLCALAIVVAGSVPTLAVDTDANPGQSASYYPISVEEYTYGSLDEPRIEKVYQLSLSDDPSGIPTEDFVRGGRLYYLLDMTRKNEVGVDTKPLRLISSFKGQAAASSSYSRAGLKLANRFRALRIARSPASGRFSGGRRYQGEVAASPPMEPISTASAAFACSTASSVRGTP